jgi:hypothetical protein
MMLTLYEEVIYIKDGFGDVDQLIYVNETGLLTQRWLNPAHDLAIHANCFKLASSWSRCSR